MVHPYRLRNRGSLLANLKQGDITVGFAETVDDFMNQFYTFKTFLMRIGFLERDSHFAFNLSNVHSFKEPKQLCMVNNLTQEMMEIIFSYLNSSENLNINRLSKWFQKAVGVNWERRAFEQKERIRTL